LKVVLYTRNSTELNSFIVAGSSKDDTSICNMKNGKNTELPSFWIPAMTPDATPTKVEKPVRHKISLLYV